MVGEKFMQLPGPIEASEEMLFVSKEKFSCTPWAKDKAERRKKINKQHICFWIFIILYPFTYSIG